MLAAVGRLALAALLGAFAGWELCDWKAAADLAATTEKHRVSEAAALEELQRATQKNQDLDRCIAAGRGCGLRVKVAACTSVSATPGVGQPASQTAELDPSARSDYRALRDGIVRLEQALKVCVNAPAQH